MNEAAVEEVRAAIQEFVRYVAESEPRTHLYASWQQRDDPTRFVQPRPSRSRDGPDR